MTRLSGAVLRQGRRLITGANDGTVRVWNFSNGQMLQQLKNESKLEISCITFIVEGQNKFIVSGGWNRKVLVWRDEATSSAAAIEPDRVMNGHDEDILSIAYSAPNLLCTSGYDGRLLVWNMDSAILKHKLTIPACDSLDVDQRAMWKVLFLEKRSQALVSASADGKLRFWNVKEGALVWEQHSYHKNEGVVALATELTNSYLFSGDGAGYLKIWDVSNFLNVTNLDQRHNVVELAHWKAHDECIVSIDYIERHRLILTASSDTRMKLWRFDQGGVFFAGSLGEGSQGWGLSSDTFYYDPVELEPPRGQAKAAPAAAPTVGAATDQGSDSGSFRGMPKLSTGPDESAEDTAGSSRTHDLIQQILTGRGSRKVAVPGTFRSLRTHDLADVMTTPRSNHGDTPRGGGLRRGGL